MQQFETKTDTCGVFQLYFTENLFNRLHERYLIIDQKLTKNTIHKFFNEIFSLEKEMN